MNPCMIVACLVDNNLIWDAHLDAFVLQKDVGGSTCGVEKFNTMMSLDFFFCVCVCSFL